MGPSYGHALPVILVLCLLISPSVSTHPRVWCVGRESGWVPNPSEPYDQWAGRTRFVVGDKLVFKYEKGKDSVLEVTKEAYEACNRSSPIKKRTSGESVEPLEKPGLLYFISGVEGHCEKGQKLALLVISKRPTVPPPSPTPKGQPPASPCLGPSTGSPSYPPPPQDIPSPAGPPHSAGDLLNGASDLVGAAVGLVMLFLMS